MKHAGKPYKFPLVTGRTFDGIVIGSGMGGLSVAALLAREGKKILVLEQHYVAGGFTHVFKRGDYEWDVGLHYIGGADDKHSVVRKTFDYISNGQLEWASMDEAYDIAVFGDKEYVFYRGKERCRAQLKQYFPSPADQVSIDRYFELLEETDHLGMGYYLDKLLPSVLSTIAGPLLKAPLLKFADKTTRAVLEGITGNEELIGVLTTQYGDYGLPPAQSSFYMHAMVANHYMNGAAYPVGGPSSIAASITAVIEKNGGMVLTGAEVQSIQVEKNRATGVKMADGNYIPAPLVISDTGIKNTFLHLLDENTRLRHRLAEKTAALTPATAHVCLYIGLKGSSTALGLPKCNYWVFPPCYNHDASRAAYLQPADPVPAAYISFPSAKDPDWEQRYPGRSTVEIVNLVPWEWFEKWEQQPWSKRGADYEALKEQMARQLLQALFRIKPWLEEHIDYYELSTPLSTQTFTHHSRGEIYGLAHSPERFRQEILRPASPVSHLYLTGQDVFTAGVSGAMMGGVLCATAILRKNMLKKIKDTIAHPNQPH